MYEFFRCLPPAGALLGIFGSIATCERSLPAAVILMAVAAASVAFMRWDGNYGID